EAWDWKRIVSIINTVSQNLPSGITLVLEVGEKEKFISRHLVTAPECDNRPSEHLLDGQQRLTALWRVLHNNYDWDTYFIFVPDFDDYGDKDSNEQFVFRCGRYLNSSGQRYPLWCDTPKDCLKRGMIPTHLLRPGDHQDEIDKWIKNATDYRKPQNTDELEQFFNWKITISDKIKDLRSIIKNYNIPFLSLPTSTEKDVALDVFINMNTNSKPLSAYDIIVAEIESVKGESLHDLQNELNKKYPDIILYFNLPYLILNTSALLQEKLPNNKGLLDMDKSDMIDNWNEMEKGLNEMSAFLHNEGIIDHDRLPTNAVLAVIAALYPHIRDKGDERGMSELLLKKYLWSAFFTDRYENSAATNAYSDYIALKRIIINASNEEGTPYTEADVPIFDRQKHPISDADELLTAGWPKGSTIRGKAILAVACRLGSYDFATGHKIDRTNISRRQYHHIYPDALLKEAGIKSYCALNCSLIADGTNQNIG
ncbi:MAG: DUF262 domain-containing protein, partial [Gammaproteobacteria bacterium]|nr:DUF262 domain-containing protein [Gammaproteobacteria bacterium]